MATSQFILREYYYLWVYIFLPIYTRRINASVNDAHVGHEKARADTWDYMYSPSRTLSLRASPLYSSRVAPTVTLG